MAQSAAVISAAVISAAVISAAVVAGLAVVAFATEEAPLPAAANALVSPPPDFVVRSFDGSIARQFVDYLAGPLCAGRAAGTLGCDQAGAYIEAHVDAWKLEKAGDDESFQQRFDVRMLPFPAQRVSANPTGGNRSTFNVCALLRGSDPVLKRQFVVVSAHYDHVGTLDGKTHFNGGDDNASGIAALMLVARAFAAPAAPRPKRSILFLFFSAEERGLLGSKHWVSQASGVMDNVVCNVNMDMVGRNDRGEMHVYGNGSSPELDEVHRRVALSSGIRWRAKIGSVYKRSDQASFYDQGVPALYYTSGLHRDYHTIGDVAERVDAEKVAAVARHTYRVVWDLANRAGRPRFTEMGPNASVGALEAMLAMVPRDAVPDRVRVPEDAGVVVLQTVIDDGGAERAGLRPGDMVLGVGESAWLPGNDPVTALEDAADDARRDGTMLLRVQRGSKVKLVRVDLR